MAAIDISLPSAFQDAQQSLGQQITRADVITSKTTGVQDADLIDTSGSLDAHLVQPSEGYRTSGLSFDTFVDIEPRSPNVVAWGKTIKFNFGLEGHALLTRVEVFFEVGAIDHTGGDATAKDATVYPKYLAERLLGDEVDVKLQQERVAKFSVDALHYERMLMMDQANSEREGYEAGVGVDETAAAQTVWVPMRLPYGRDKPLVALAFAEEHQLSFTIPTWAQIRRFRGARGGGADVGNASTLKATEPSISCFLRVHYTEVDQPSRAAYSQRMISKGHSYFVSVLEKDTDDEFTVAAAGSAAAVKQAVERESRIGLIHPSACLVGIVRDANDLEEAANMVFGAIGSTAEALFAGTINPCPDRFAAQPPVWWELLEKKNRVYPRMSWKYFSAACHPKLFPSENFFPGAVVPNTPHPTLADKHALGHLTYSNMQDPALKIAFRRSALFDDSVNGDEGDVLELQGLSREYEALQAYPDASNVTVTGAAKTFNILKFSIAPNFLKKANARVWLAYQ